MKQKPTKIASISNLDSVIELRLGPEVKELEKQEEPSSRTISLQPYSAFSLV